MMKRGKFESMITVSRLKMIQFLIGLLFIYLLLMSFEIPVVLRAGSGSDGDGSVIIDKGAEEWQSASRPSRHRRFTRRMREYKRVSSLVFNESLYDDKNGPKDEFSILHRTAKEAWVIGKRVWEELGSVKANMSKPENKSESACPYSVTVTESEFGKQGRVLMLPCGLTLGSHITVVGKPHWAHLENDPKIALLKEGEEALMVSQFMMELQGLKTVDGEDPPRILHFNPRLKGDWSSKPVIEMNTCYRMQWGSALRCEGWKSRADEETSESLFFIDHLVCAI